MFKYIIKRIFYKFQHWIGLDQLKINQGLIMSRLNETLGVEQLVDSEFKVFSQFGDDGIIQFLINKLKIIEPFFIEFGVSDYMESNTRFLLIKNNFSGFILDGDIRNVNIIRKSNMHTQYNLRAHCAWITKENINDLMKMSSFDLDKIGLLHIDIDGNDYWIWKELKFSPQIIIVEYNSVFGHEKSLTVPYDPKFYRTNAHYSNLYYGASLKAMVKLGDSKGYDFVGVNTARNNAYFVRKDINVIPRVDSILDISSSQFSESRFKNGKLSYLRGEDRVDLIKGLKLFDLD